MEKKRDSAVLMKMPGMSEALLDTPDETSFWLNNMKWSQSIPDGAEVPSKECLNYWPMKSCQLPPNNSTALSFYLSALETREDLSLFLPLFFEWLDPILRICLFNGSRAEPRHICTFDILTWKAFTEEISKTNLTGIYALCRTLEWCSHLTEETQS